MIFNGRMYQWMYGMNSIDGKGLEGQQRRWLHVVVVVEAISQKITFFPRTSCLPDAEDHTLSRQLLSKSEKKAERSAGVRTVAIQKIIKFNTTIAFHIKRSGTRTRYCLFVHNV
jgi:hypothetical protein